jgi:cell division protein FtsQ
LFLATVFSGLGWIAYRGVHYLRTAPQFEVKKLSVAGVKHVSVNQVLAKAGFEVGTNVFAVDLAEIRERVEQLQWVRHALAERVLPDQIIIKVVEREPIGLARIRGEIYQFDIDATILEPDPAAGANFPILDGLSPADRPGNLKRVQIYREVLEQLSPNSLSEIHIDNASEVSVVSTSDPLIVSLGTNDFRNRWVRYLQLKPQIQQRYPQALRVDLRFKNQVIIKMKDDQAAENIPWDIEKKTL